MTDASVRTKKVASLLQRELADIIRSEINDPRVRSIGMITVSGVELANDFRNATVFVSFMGEFSGKKQTQAAIDVLNGAAPFVRNLLLKRVSMKAIPQLYFKYDRSFEAAAKVHEAFHRIDKPSSEEE